jgi:biopolymer transport protein ExbD
MGKVMDSAAGDRAEIGMTSMIDMVFNLLIFFMLITELKQKDLAELTLPPAYMAEADKGGENDDRIILNIDNRGGLLWKGNRVTLDEMGTILQSARDRYDIKMKQKGLTGLEDIGGGRKASKLFVLLRADKDAPWQHVQWLMTIMAEQRIYKLQFATKQFKDGYISDAEAKELDAINQTEFRKLEKKKG